MTNEPNHRSPLVHRVHLTAGSSERRLLEVESGASASFRDLVAGAASFGAALLAQGHIEPGDHVLILAPPGIAWARAFLAVLFAGGAVVAAPLAAPRSELAYITTDSGARLAIVSNELADELPAHLSKIDVASAIEAPPELPVIDAAAAALVLYTSGTTGKPKGAVLTHENLAAQTSSLRDAWGFAPNDVLLHTLPLHHLHGVVVAFLTALTTPAEIHMLAKFDAGTICDELSRVTVFMAVPTMYRRLLDHADALDAGRRDAFERACRGLRLATSGSAALPVTLAERWRTITGAIPLERYGMTEIGIALSNPLDPAGRKPGMVGTPLPTVEIRIIAEDGTDTDGPGELWVRGPSVMKGYLGREEATRASFRDGWFTTGDIAVRDEDGHVRLLGRSSTDILKTGGEKVSALEIEEVLREHEAIAEVAVVGIPDPMWGDRVVAAIVPKDGAASACTTDLLRAWAKQRLAAYKVPKDFVTMPALPRNAMGKVLKPDIVRALSQDN
ncbi:MAG: AMP-binding protein [Polyangiaceae bacterium]|nr:AMP-binding protein [Polyangiaceae bacterium]